MAPRFIKPGDHFAIRQNVFRTHHLRSRRIATRTGFRGGKGTKSPRDDSSSLENSSHKSHLDIPFQRSLYTITLYTKRDSVRFCSPHAIRVGLRDGTEARERCCSERSHNCVCWGGTYLESTTSFKRIQKTTLTDRLVEFAQNARDKADKLEAGPERQALLEKARRAELASEFAAWANSPRGCKTGAMT